MMRILWAFEINWAQGTQKPVDPISYTRSSEMPGNPSSRLPVTLRILNQAKADIINRTFENAKRERAPIVSVASWHGMAIGFANQFGFGIRGIRPVYLRWINFSTSRGVEHYICMGDIHCVFG
jgi:hypothetical protein